MSKTKANFLFIALSISLLNGYAQQTPSGKDSVAKIRNEYKQSLENLILVQVDANTETNDIKFKKVNNQSDFNIVPNNDINLRVTLQYRFLGLAYSFSPLHTNEDTKGKSSYSLLALDLPLANHISMSYSYGTTTGYYLQNTSDYKTQLINPSKPYAIFPDVKTTLFRAENFYYFNGTKFSIIFPMNQDEIQKKSVGSLVIPLNYYFYKIDFRNEKFSDLNVSASNVYPNFLKDNYIITGIGYAYNWVIKPQWIFSVKAIPVVGLDINHTTYTNATASHKNQFTFGYRTGGVFSYITQNWMAGVSADLSAWKSLSTVSDLTGNQNRFKIFVGKCFKAPSSIEKVFDKVEHLF